MLLEEEAGIVRHLHEPPAAIVAIQRARPVVRDEKIEEAVAVEVRHGGADAAELVRLARRLDTPLARHVDEMTAVVPEQSVRVAVLVRNEQIQVAVSVDVEPDGTNGLARIADTGFR